MDRVGRAGGAELEVGASALWNVLWGVVVIAAGVGVSVGVLWAPTSGSYALTVPVLVGGAVAGREGLAALVGWIVGGVVLGAALGYGAHGIGVVPLTQLGATGMGAALGGGVGALVNFVSVGEAELESDDGVTVDMGREETPEPRPADLFDDHPDPVLYVADEGGGPIVRAANDAYGVAFDLPSTTLSGAPLADALVVLDDTEAVVESLAAGGPIDREAVVETATGETTFRVRSVGDPADGYVLFTPVERAD